MMKQMNENDFTLYRPTVVFLSTVCILKRINEVYEYHNTSRVL